jgi:hypothetical protein
MALLATVKASTRHPLQTWDRVQSLKEAQATLEVQPRRSGRPDAERELATIARFQTQAHLICQSYERRFGRIFNADNMSELLDVHGSERWEHHDAVRSSASAATQYAFDSALAASVTEWDEVVLFSAGGNGAGKSTAVAGLPVSLGLDSTLSDFDSSKRNIEAVLATGRSVLILFIYRQPVDALLHGVLTRMLDPQNGRPVTIRTHASTHAGAPRTLLRLAEAYSGHKVVAICILENRTGDGPLERDVEWLHSCARADRRVLEAELAAALHAEVVSGRAPDAVAHRLYSA